MRRENGLSKSVQAPMVGGWAGCLSRAQANAASTSDGVNIAAQLEPLAEPGGICVSNAVFEQVRNKVAHSLAPLGPAELKDIYLPVVVHWVVWPWLPAK